MAWRAEGSTLAESAAGVGAGCTTGAAGLTTVAPSAPQVGAQQPLSQQLSHSASQHEEEQPLCLNRWPSNPPWCLPKIDEAQPQEGSQLESQPLSQQSSVSQPHSGSESQQLSHTGAPQLGSLQPLSQQPLLRSSNSKPKLWADNTSVTTRVPRYKFHFIDRGLLGNT
ncbi:MAG: hypothetical protein CMJ80_17130 [Planctomycetaceae bacterium]|nr:hypothetical protein [Planctomycetaceae bacterium]